MHQILLSATVALVSVIGSTFLLASDYVEGKLELIPEPQCASRYGSNRNPVITLHQRELSVSTKTIHSHCDLRVESKITGYSAQHQLSIHSHAEEMFV